MPDFYDIVNGKYMKKISSTSTILVSVFVVLIGLFGLALWQQVRPTGLNDFADCLTEKGAVMYGAWWCPHCQDQKAMFGPSFKRIKSVECGAGKGQFNKDACPNITSTPSWADKDGVLTPGTASLQELSERYSCPLPEGK